MEIKGNITINDIISRIKNGKKITFIGKDFDGRDWKHSFFKKNKKIYCQLLDFHDCKCPYCGDTAITSNSHTEKCNCLNERYPGTVSYKDMLMDIELFITQKDVKILENESNN